MEVVLLPSAAGPDPSAQFLTSFVVDGTLAVDAGSLGLWADLAGQERVRDIVLTHPHIDHVASLPVFLENVYGTGPAVRVHGSPETLDSLRRDVFNDRLFPDLFSRPPSANAPFLVTHELPPRERTAIGGHHVTAVPVSHPIPTLGVLVERGRSAVLIATDTGPADDLWRFAAGVKHLKAVFLDVAFPESLGWLADVSGHLTPSRFAAEVRKVPAGVPVYAIHLKPRYREVVRDELAALGLDRVSVMEPGRTYHF